MQSALPAFYFLEVYICWKEGGRLRNGHADGLLKALCSALRFSSASVCIELNETEVSAQYIAKLIST